MRNARHALLATLLMMTCSPVSAERLVREFSGSSSVTTAEFEVEAPWLLDWRLNGEYETMLAIDIMLLDGRTGRHLGQVLHTKRRGNGVKLFQSSGRFKLRIDTTLARWQIKIIQITSEEAELYTPRKQSN